MTEYKLLIGGELVDGDSSMDIIDPATEEILAVCPRGSEAQMDAAVAAAKAAFPAWSRRPIAERRAMLAALADAIEVRRNDFARLLTQEQGKPLTEATAEIVYTCAFVRYLASLDLPVKVIEDSETRRIEQHRRPLGVLTGRTPRKGR